MNLPPEAEDVCRRRSNGSGHRGQPGCRAQECPPQSHEPLYHECHCCFWALWEWP